MSKSTLSQVLAAFENSRGPITMAEIARELDLTPARLEGMIQYWVRKGKLRQASLLSECGSCSHGDGSCPFVIELPRSYELVNPERASIPLSSVNASCDHRRKK